MIAPISLADLAHKYGGVLLQPDYQLQSLSIDSRSVDAGQIFVALKGDNFDGHAYLKNALQKGASALVTEVALPISESEPTAPQWIVKNSMRALGQIGAENRDMFRGKLIALTGSNGKTTVKEMIACILRQSGEVLATKGNLNNHIGVPLTLLSLDPKHQFAVVEMGANSMGEIHYLTELARPDVALVNNVGDAHIGQFGGQKNIEIAKGEIFDGLSHAGVGVINLDSLGAERYANKLIDRKTLSFSIQSEAADLRAVNIKLTDSGSEFLLITAEGEYLVSIQAPAEHNVRNALAAAACCLAIGVPVKTVVSGLKDFEGVAGRLQQHRLGCGAVLIDDTYNASPSSVRAAIRTLSRMSGRKTLVLGAMAELGEQSDYLHREVGEFAKDQGIDRLLCVGSIAAHAAYGFSSSRKGGEPESFASKQEAVNAVLEELGKDAKILVKGSRSSRMEDVVNSIKEKGA